MITLKSRIKIKREYAGSSKYYFWKEIKPGDILEIAMPLKDIGHYKPEITLTKNNGSDSFISSMTLICNYLGKLEYEEL